MKQNIVVSKLIYFIDRIGIYILAFIAAILNISIAFDNVVWGDEAYSQMAIINTNLYGVYERVYYWDSHPPLYYYYLKLIADIFGYHTSVYHIASIVPFIVGLVIACTLIKKHLGTLPTIFFILISAFSESCVEYNLEIRMYSLVFMFVFLCVCDAYLIIKNGTTVSHFVLMTLFGILAAYTHYYGLAICGLIIFFTGLFNLISCSKRKYDDIHTKKSCLKKSLLAWIISTLVYIITYIPWLFVLYFQTQAELNAAWMTAPAPFSDVLKFIMGGNRLEPILLSFIIVMTIIITINELGVITLETPNASNKVKLAFHKPSFRNLSVDFKTMLLMYVSILGLLAFGYGVSYAFHPILAFRYTYVLIPLVLFIFMICVRKLFIYIFPSSEGHLFDTNKRLPALENNKIITTIGIIVMVGMLLICTLFSLLDFKYFRSVTKTQNVETQKVLDIIGEPNDDAILVVNNVKHLAWTVLPYYYNNEIVTDSPETIGMQPSELWAFTSYTYDNDVLDNMLDKGYTYEAYMNMWLGKYAVNLYHFYK